jgi:hypothetical protein
LNRGRRFERAFVAAKSPVASRRRAAKSPAVPVDSTRIDAGVTSSARISREKIFDDDAKIARVFSFSA